LYEPFLPQLFVWLPIAAFCHSYLLYPLTLRWLPKRFPLPQTIVPGDWPCVAVLISVYNEESCIAAKIQNTLALDYDPNKLEILVGSDGSTDRTVTVVREFAPTSVRLIEFAARSGKSAVLNRLAMETTADILVMTDANAKLEPQSLRHLVQHFRDPAVGAVSGAKLVYTDINSENLRGETSYSGFENSIKSLESVVGGTSGCRGALMGARRTDFRPFPTGTINDDLVLALSTIRSGKRVVFDPHAAAHEESAKRMIEEFHRRVRIGAGDLQAFFHFTSVLNPCRGLVAYTFFSHKVLRWLLPTLLPIALFSNLFLLDSPLYFAPLFVYVIIACLSIIGWFFDLRRRNVAGVTQLYYFAAMNLALFFGFLYYLSGRHTATWERTPRSAP
jgi:cellulose synthase/poly-beta-1,6-N-acetylglucosamine synthase-like glycosyltransferase